MGNQDHASHPYLNRTATARERLLPVHLEQYAGLDHPILMYARTPAFRRGLGYIPCESAISIDFGLLPRTPNTGPRTPTPDA